MTDKRSEKWLDEELTRAADFGAVRFDSQAWKEKYALNESSESSVSCRYMGKYRSIWRTIMESKVTKFSAAAVIILALTLVLFGPFWSPGNGGVVLADVQKKVDDVETMIIGGTKTFTRPGKPDSLFEFDGIKCKFDLVKFYSKQHGFVEEGYTEGKLFYRITFNFVERRTLILLPTYKKFLTFTSMNDMAKIMENFATPKGILDLLVEGDYKELGRDKIDGIDAEVFESEDTESFKELLPKPVFNIQTFRAKLWIGIKEQLPVRIEAELVIGKSFMSAFQNLNLHEVNTLGDYNVELDEKIFDTTPPEGYTEVTLTDILSQIPTEAQAGIVGMGLVPIGLIAWRRRKKRNKTAEK